MSWGERSCKHIRGGNCPIPDECNMGTCNVECRKYEWDGVTRPDSGPKSEHAEKLAQSAKQASGFKPIMSKTQNSSKRKKSRKKR